MEKSLLETTMGHDFAKIFGKPIPIDEYVEERDFRSDPGIELPEDNRTSEEIEEEEALREEIHNHEHD